MSFLSNKRLLQILPTCINPYDPGRIESGAYELSMGNEYFTTNAETATKTVLAEKEQFVIEPGQFALLITKETISGGGLIQGDIIIINHNFNTGSMHHQAFTKGAGFAH